MAPIPGTEIMNISYEITEKYKEILKSNGINDEVAEVVVKDAGLQGEGIVSKAWYVTVNFVDQSVKPLNLFVKSLTESDAHKDMIGELKAFEKEARFLTSYVDEARELCKSKGQEEVLNIYPKCYYGDEAMIVMENLVLDKGFVLANKEIMQTLDQAKCALQTLAKHHAISLAMIQKYGGPDKLFEKFVNLNYEPFDKPIAKTMMEPVVENGLNTCIKILESNSVEGNGDALALLKSMRGKVLEVIVKMVEKDEEKLKVLNHGDYWNNNMMFKIDDETNRVLDHKAIDLQVTRYGAPGLDLGYYLFTSLQPTVRRAHLKDLLNLYLTTLKSVAHDLDCTIDLTFEELFMMYRRKFKLGFWFASCIAGGPGKAVLKEIDMGSLQNMDDFAKEYDRLIQKWLFDHPDKSLELAKELVELLAEYRQLDVKGETAEKYKRILKANGITHEVVEVIVKDAGLHGEGYGSKPLYVTVNFADPSVRSLNFFVKAHTSSDALKKMVDDVKGFEKEAMLLTNYVDVARELCKSKGQEELLNIYPKCYYGDNELIVMENLVLDKGFVLVDKEVMQNLEQAKVGVQTLAKHHAISLAMIQKYGGPEKFFEKFQNLDYEAYARPVFRSMMEPMMESGLNTCIQILENNAVEGDKEALALLKANVGQSYNVFLKNVENAEEKLLVLNHGDYHSNNMMYKLDKDTNQVLDHKAIDFQVTRYGSPALDLGYYFFISIQPAVRRAHLKDLLNLYLTTLKSTARDLDCTVVLTYEELFAMFQRKFKLGFWFACCIARAPGITILKEMDVTALKNISDWATESNTFIQKWLRENPDRGNGIAKDLVQLLEEYRQLNLDE